MHWCMVQNVVNDVRNALAHAVWSRGELTKHHTSRLLRVPVVWTSSVSIQRSRAAVTPRSDDRASKLTKLTSRLLRVSVDQFCASSMFPCSSGTTTCRKLRFPRDPDLCD